MWPVVHLAVARDETAMALPFDRDSIRMATSHQYDKQQGTLEMEHPELSQKVPDPSHPQYAADCETPVRFRQRGLRSLAAVLITLLTASPSAGQQILKWSGAERDPHPCLYITAKDIGRLDIGQCVVVGGGSVLAVEAIDGTDATIQRGGKLGEGTAVIIKVCKPGQDFRFDVPAVGAQTIMTMNDAGAKVLVVEAGKAVVFDREEMINLADRYGISIVARKTDDG